MRFGDEAAVHGPVWRFDMPGGRTQTAHPVVLKTID